MKSIIVLVTVLLASNASAIEFITEAEVLNTLGADKVIEISKYTAQDKLVQKDSDCEQALNSRSGRAYVIKKGNKAILAVTPSGLKGLLECGEL